MAAATAIIAASLVSAGAGAYSANQASSAANRAADLQSQYGQAGLDAQLQMFHTQRNDVNNAVNAALGYWQPNNVTPTYTQPTSTPAASPTGTPSNNPVGPTNLPGQVQIPDLSNLGDISSAGNIHQDPNTGLYTYTDPQTGEVFDLGASGLTPRQFDASGNVIWPGQPGYNTQLESAQRGAQDTRYTNRAAQGDVYSEPAAPDQGGQWIPGDLERYYDPAISMMSDTADANMWAYDEAKGKTLAANKVTNRAADLMANPSNVWNMPGTKEEFKTGLEAMQSGFSKSMGGGTSGRVMVAAQEYGKQFTRDALDRELDLLDREVGFYDKDLSRLSPFIQMGYEARNNAANLMAQRGITTANIRVGAPAGLSGLAGQTASGISQASQNIGNAWANNAINQANIQGNQATNLSNNVNSLATLYAMRPDLFKTS